MDEAVATADRLAARRADPPAAGDRGHRAAEPGRRVVRHVRGLRGPRPRVRRGRGPAGGRRDEHDAGDRRPPDAAQRGAPDHARTQITLQRERHEPEYGILVAIVALAAIGILMVYSSSAMKAFLQRDDTFAIVGPQIQWAALGMVAMVAMMRIDYRWLRVASVPLFVDRDRRPDPRLRRRDQHRRRRIGALAQGRTAAGRAPGRVHEARARDLPRPLVREARRRRAQPVARHAAVPRDHRAGRPARAPRARPRHVVGAGVHGVHDVLPRGREPHPPRGHRGRGRARGRCCCCCAATRWTASAPGSTPGRTRRASGSTACRAISRSRSAAWSGRGSARAGSPAGCSCPTRSNDFIFAIIGEEFGLLGARAGDPAVPRVRLPRASGRRSAPPTRSAPCWRPGSRAGSASRRSSTSRSWSGLIPVTGIPLPFVSAGGSSLIISFAAVGHPAVGVPGDGRERNLERCAC